MFFSACAQTQIVRPHLLSTHGNIYHYFCVPRLLVHHFYSFYIQGYYSEKPFSSPAGVTRAGFKLIRPVVCMESEFKNCNLA